jgi:hypothetical protein
MRLPRLPLVAMPPGWLSCIAQERYRRARARKRRLGRADYADVPTRQRTGDRGVADGGC